MRRPETPRATTPKPSLTPMSSEQQFLASKGLDADSVCRLTDLMGSSMKSFCEWMKAIGESSSKPIANASDACERCLDIAVQVSQAAATLVEHCRDVCVAPEEADNTALAQDLRLKLVKALTAVEVLDRSSVAGRPAEKTPSAASMHRRP